MKLQIGLFALMTVTQVTTGMFQLSINPNRTYLYMKTDPKLPFLKFFVLFFKIFKMRQKSAFWRSAPNENSNAPSRVKMRHFGAIAPNLATLTKSKEVRTILRGCSQIKRGKDVLRGTENHRPVLMGGARGFCCYAGKLMVVGS